MVLGAVVRIYLVVFTEGTSDVAIWQQHAAGIRDSGLIGYYHSNPYMNHPPFIGMVMSWLLRIADATGVPFRVLLRAPFALLDAGTTLLLFLLLRQSPWRFVVAACYWLNPLSLIISAYHGNTDSAVAFSVLLSVWLLARGKTIPAGVALGAGFWIKLPGVLAIPTLFFFIRGWRRRLIFLATIGITALLTYLPALIQDAEVVRTNVFGYHGQMLRSLSGQPVWGLKVLMFMFLPPPNQWSPGGIHLANFLLQHSWTMALICLLLLAWLRRSNHSAPEACATLAACYTIIYGLSNNWAFQYFAWSLPLWFFATRWFCVPALVLAGGYLYSLYWYLCGNPWLYGNWDFVGRPDWPMVVIDFRNAAVLFFFISAWVFLICALVKQIAAWMRRPDSGHIGNCKS